MYCKYCGAEIDDDSLVCCRCGRSLRKPVPRPQSPQSHSRSPRQNYRYDSSSHNSPSSSYSNQSSRYNQTSTHGPRYLNKNAPQKSVGKKIFKIIWSLIIIGLMVFGIIYRLNPDNNILGIEQMREAYSWAQEAISQAIYTPSTAKFPEFTSDFIISDQKTITYEDTKYRIYLINAYVDSQNTFGAMERSYFLVSIGLPVTQSSDGVYYNVSYLNITPPSEEDIESAMEIEISAIQSLDNEIQSQDSAPIASTVCTNPALETSLEETAPIITTSSITETLASEMPEIISKPLFAPELLSVLEGQSDVYMGYAGTSMNLFSMYEVCEYYDLETYEPLSLEDFAVVDLDRNGTNEVVVTLMNQSIPWRLILQLQDGVVYGYGYSYRGMQSISTDGRTVSSNSATDSSINTLSFDYSDIYLTPYIPSDGSDPMDGWDEVEWLPFTHDNIMSCYLQ